jgi:hypothetical protein
MHPAEKTNDRRSASESEAEARRGRGPSPPRLATWPSSFSSPASAFNPEYTLSHGVLLWLFVASFRVRMWSPNNGGVAAGRQTTSVGRVGDLCLRPLLGACRLPTFTRVPNQAAKRVKEAGDASPTERKGPATAADTTRHDTAAYPHARRHRSRPCQPARHAPWLCVKLAHWRRHQRPSLGALPHEREAIEGACFCKGGRPLRVAATTARAETTT